MDMWNLKKTWRKAKEEWSHKIEKNTKQDE